MHNLSSYLPSITTHKTKRILRDGNLSDMSSLWAYRAGHIPDRLRCVMKQNIPENDAVQVHFCNAYAICDSREFSEIYLVKIGFFLQRAACFRFPENSTRYPYLWTIMSNCNMKIEGCLRVIYNCRMLIVKEE